MARRAVNYLSNKNLLAEIHKSKISYCEYNDPNHTRYDLIVEDIKDITDDAVQSATENFAKKVGVPIETVRKTDLVFRVHTYEHIPEKYHKINKSAETDIDYCRLNFIPFKHYVFDSNNNLQLVLTSHSKDGKFCDKQGQITTELAKMFILLVDRYSQRPNWRGYSYLDEMQGNGLLQLNQFALQFNEMKSENPFAYYTTFLENAFTRVLLVEQKHQSIRDNLLETLGQNPSNTRQLENEEYVNTQKNEHWGND